MGTRRRDEEAVSEAIFVISVSDIDFGDKIMFKGGRAVTPQNFNKRRVFHFRRI